MVRTFLFCALAAAAGCSFGDDRPLTPGGDGGPDGKPDGMMDGPPMPDKDHLLISEIKSDGTGEFVEIWNPTTRTITLTNYYLADFADYWKLPAAGVMAIPDTDFLVRFPAAAMLAPGAVLTVATSSAGFQTRYTMPATYAIDATSGPQMMADRKIGINTTQFTNNGEVVILFYWDGVSDLVQDVDIIFAGRIQDSTTGNRLNTKTQVDGPDPDAVASMYKPDNGLVGDGMSAAASDTVSFKRRAFETGNETQSKTGNGITGDDETSEVISVTWDGNPTLLSAPNPGVAPAL